MINEAHEPSSACRLWRLSQVETSTPPASMANIYRTQGPVKGGTQGVANKTNDKPDKIPFTHADLAMPKRTDIHSVLIIGAGPIIIGQACEFDYSGTQACKALKEEGYRVMLVNSNPATIMTDPEFADRTYLEPITPECVEKIIAREVSEMKHLGVPVNQSPITNHRSPLPHKLVLLPTLGGQTALNTAMALFRRGTFDRYGVELIGANAKAIERGEDRQV